jgi:hypothetical protein
MDIYFSVNVNKFVSILSSRYAEAKKNSCILKLELLDMTEKFSPSSISDEIS